MANVDYTELGLDTKFDRKYKVCGKCNEKSAVTVLCPVREKITDKDGKPINPYVCVYCCWKCGFSKVTPQGRKCIRLANRYKRKQEEKEAEKAAKKKKKSKKL